MKRVEEIFSKVHEQVDYPLRALVINGNDPKAGNEWATKIHELYPDMKIEQVILDQPLEPI